MQVEAVGQLGEAMEVLHQLIAIQPGLHVLDEAFLLAEVAFPNRFQRARVVDEVLAAGLAELFFEDFGLFSLVLYRT